MAQWGTQFKPENIIDMEYSVLFSILQNLTIPPVPLTLITLPTPLLNKQTSQINLTKQPVPLTLITLPALLLVPTLIPRTQFFPTTTPWLQAAPTQTSSNPHHQDTITVGTTLPYNHPPTFHNTTYQQKEQPIAKIKQNTDDILSFYLKK